MAPNLLQTNGLFGNLEREGRRIVGRRVEGNGSPPPCLNVFKINKGKRIISPSPCLDVLKITIERRGNN